MKSEFQGFPKMGRLFRPCIITEKIDGTNAQIFIDDEGEMHVGSRNRWITPGDDNHGFARWCAENKDELMKLGPGRHFGEWWGSGINRGYGLTKGEKRFSLFNALRWCMHDVEPEQIFGGMNPNNVRMQDKAPACCHIVPVLFKGEFDTSRVQFECDALHDFGSQAAPGFMKPEGVITFHIAGNVGFKTTLDNDGIPKSLVK
jgi:hypothetical protein